MVITPWNLLVQKVDLLIMCKYLRMLQNEWQRQRLKEQIPGGTIQNKIETFTSHVLFGIKDLQARDSGQCAKLKRRYIGYAVCYTNSCSYGLAVQRIVILSLILLYPHVNNYYSRGGGLELYTREFLWVISILVSYHET